MQCKKSNVFKGHLFIKVKRETLALLPHLLSDRTPHGTPRPHDVQVLLVAPEGRRSLGPPPGPGYLEHLGDPSPHRTTSYFKWMSHLKKKFEYLYFSVTDRMTQRGLGLL